MGGASTQRSRAQLLTCLDHRRLQCSKSGVGVLPLKSLENKIPELKLIPKIGTHESNLLIDNKYTLVQLRKQKLKEIITILAGSTKVQHHRNFPPYIIKVIHSYNNTSTRSITIRELRMAAPHSQFEFNHTQITFKILL